MPELNPQPLPPVADRVRVFVTRDVAYDLDKMHRITADVLKRVGCPGCHSGRVLDFVMLQDFIVNPETLDVREVTGPVAS